MILGSCCPLPVADLRCSVPNMSYLWQLSFSCSQYLFSFLRNKKGLLPFIGPGFPGGQHLSQTNSCEKSPTLRVNPIMNAWDFSVLNC